MNLSMLNLLPVIEWVASSSLSKAISTSTWAFAVIESIHLLALSVIGGAVLIVDLQLLGFGIRTQTLAEVARDAQKMVSRQLDGDDRHRPAAVLVGAAEAVLQHAVRGEDDLPAARDAFSRSRCGGGSTLAGEGRVSPLVMKLVALVSLALWFGVGAGGRWIGFSG